MIASLFNNKGPQQQNGDVSPESLMGVFCGAELLNLNIQEPSGCSHLMLRTPDDAVSIGATVCLYQVFVVRICFVD